MENAQLLQHTNMDGLQLDTQRFISILQRLIGVSKQLQNNPPELVPREDAASSIIIGMMFHC